MDLLKNKLFTVFSFSFFWAVCIIANKAILNQGGHPFIVPTQIYLIGFLFLLALSHKKLSGFAKLSTKQRFYLLLTGLTIAGSVILGSYGLKLSSSINYGFLIKSTIIFATLIGAFFFQEKLTKVKLGLLLLFLLGLYILTSQGEILIPHLGDILIFLAALLAAISAALQKPVLKVGLSPLLLALSRVAIAGLCFLLAAPFVSQTFYIPKGGILLLLAGFSYGIYSYFLSKTLQLATLSYMTMMSMLTPVIVSILAFGFLGETITAYHLFGGGLIILSGIGVQKFKL
ncbi:DMT family transporter [Candidatus Beckwithbacteria bacterium]|nr:DMT family transporter [Candidatus Beckwithbacteria bacterium]